MNILLNLVNKLKNNPSKCVYPSGHSFFTEKYEIVQLYPKGHSFFLQRNTKFYSCTQTAIRFSQQNTKFRIVSIVL